MKIFITLLLSVCSIFLFGQDIEKFYTYSWQECEPNEARFYCTIFKTDSGYVRRDYFIHEKFLQMSGKYLDKESRVKNGYFYYFHPNGFLDASGKYENDKKEGLWLHYYPNGLLKDSGLYSNGNIIGTSLSWYSHGYMKDSTVINEEGKGVQITWFDNGNISSAGFLINNTKPSGIWKYYHKNGQISSKETYQNEVLTGKLYFDENGEAISDTSSNDRDALFPGGTKAWQKYLMKQAYFPQQFKIVNGDKSCCCSYIYN